MCSSWPDGSFESSTESYSTLQQQVGTGEVAHERVDVDEFRCDGEPYPVVQRYAPYSGRFRGGSATLLLSVRLCSEDENFVTTCVTNALTASVRLRGTRQLP